MYGTQDQSGDEASAPPRCPACQGRTYFVDPEQTVMTCYDCGRYFRRKKEDTEGSTPAPPAPSIDVPPPPTPPPEPEIPPPALSAPPPPPTPPAYSPPVQLEREPEPEPEPTAEVDDGFDLMVGDPASTAEPEPTAAPEPPEEAPEPPMEEPMAEGEAMACSVCGFPMDGDWKVCPNCVSRYEAGCDNCGKVLQAWWLICPWCETPKSEHHIHVR